MSDLQQASRINDVLYAIHQDISRDLPASELARRAAYSEQHFHRVFKAVVGEPVHQYIRRVRLEFAANQLMFDTTAPVLEVANKASFASLSSFSRAFKSMFDVPPGQWRQQTDCSDLKPYLSEPEISQCYKAFEEEQVGKPKLIETAPCKVAYVRHKGYGRSIQQAWLLLKAWAKAEERDFSEQYGIHHSNPAWVPLEQCHYVACVKIDKPILRRGLVNQLTIPGGLHAVFRLKGHYGQLLPQLSHILETWLPESGFKMKATPAFAHYHKNHFLLEDENYQLDFYLPIDFF